MATIRITDLTLTTIIGTNPWERTRKQKIIINVTIGYNASKAIKGDDIRQAIDYKMITKRIIREVTQSRFLLLETLTAFVLKLIMEEKKVKHARVRIDKPLALRFAKSVSAELESRRS
jgi:D-erythro-7,8-dihydroneopterin triphosphate epimerase